MFQVVEPQSNEIRYASRSRAKVIDNADPLQRGRIRVFHPLLGSTGWVPYLRNSGSFDVPDPGDVVYIEADTGHPEYIVAWGVITKGKDSNIDLPETFQRLAPTNRGLYTPLGARIELDDGEPQLSQSTSGNPDVIGPRITTTLLNRGIRLITMGNSIDINNPQGNRIELNDDTENTFGGETKDGIRLRTKNGLILDMIDGEANSTDRRIRLQDGSDLKVEIDSTNKAIKITSSDLVDITATGDVKITNTGNVEIETTGTITLDSSINVLAGGVVTDNPINADPITGIPLTAVGGVIAS